MKVATYNIRKAIGLDRRRDPGRVLDVLNEIEADVIVLQEADRRLGPRPSALPRRMLEAHTDFTPADVAVNDVSLGWHGNAILVRGGLSMSNPRRLALPGLEPRGAIAVDVDDRLTVVGVHLGLVRRHRKEQLARIRKHLDHAALPVSILGDFNEWSPRQGLETLGPDFEIHSPGRSFHAARPVAALDRVALSRDIEMRDAGVIETTLAKTASDHLPVWARLALPGDAARP